MPPLIGMALVVPICAVAGFHICIMAWWEVDPLLKQPVENAIVLGRRLFILFAGGGIQYSAWCAGVRGIPVTPFVRA
ncbi:MAG: hypothetical protein JJU36_09880 [Phycisphaeraceae bacterium]|nr:hypothetical protein [Phycisphaeraceae bacterium]